MVHFKDGLHVLKEVMMRMFNLMAAISLTAMFLAACHTTAGAGRDLSAAGHAITHSAVEHSY
jgi:predicted small secreted protein